MVKSYAPKYKFNISFISLTFNILNIRMPKNKASTFMKQNVKVIQEVMGGHTLDGGCSSPFSVHDSLSRLNISKAIETYIPAIIYIKF